MSRRALQRGFTLLELLVGAALTLLLVAVLLTITINVLAQWQRSAARSSQEAQAQLVLDFLERDLTGAVVRTDLGGTWLAIDVRDQSYSALTAQGWDPAGLRSKPVANSTSLHLTPPVAGSGTVADDRFGVGGAWLRFVTTKDATSTEIAAPSVVGYQLLRRPAAALPGADRRYLLYRSIVRVTKSSGASPGAFETGYDLAAAGYNTAGSFQADPGTVFAPHSADALASNVIDFGIWLSTEDGSAPAGARRLFPSSASSTSYRLAGTGPAPTIADVMIRLVSDAGATQLQNIEAGRVTRPAGFTTDDDWWWAVARENSRVFTRRIPLMARDRP